MSSNNLKILFETLKEIEWAVKLPEDLRLSALKAMKECFIDKMYFNGCAGELHEKVRSLLDGAIQAEAVVPSDPVGAGDRGGEADSGGSTGGKAPRGKGAEKAKGKA